MILSRTDRLILGILLGLALLAIGIDQLIAPSQGPKMAVGEGAEPLDLNTASFAELLRLPGIGPTLAERIITYRERNGPFRSLEELLHIRGIGPKLLQRLKGRVKLGGEPLLP
ncbi:MAG: ComEA family DNA-binding protein [Candidatus Bipolaricaulia bacterium]